MIQAALFIVALGAGLYALGAAQMRQKVVAYGGKLYLLVGAPLAQIAKLPAGDLVFDPTLTLQPDAAEGEDTTIGEASPTINYEASQFFTTQPGAGARWHGLLRFDLSSIPTGAIIISAILSLWNASANAAARTNAIHAILAANSSWTEAGAKWAFRVGTIRWAGDAGADGGADAGCSQSGVDYTAVTIGSITCEANAAVNTENQAILDATQFAAMVTANHGMVILPDATNAINWRSCEYTTAAYRPKLVVEYALGRRRSTGWATYGTAR